MMERSKKIVSRFAMFMAIKSPLCFHREGISDITEDRNSAAEAGCNFVRAVPR